MRSAGRSSSGIDAHSSRVACSSSQLEPRRELDGAQHAQAVVAEGARIDGAQDSRLADRERPSNGSRYSPVSGSKAIALIGEVAAARRVLDGHVGIALDGEAAMAAAGLRIAARQRDVDAADLVDREALADGVDRAEPCQQRRAADPRGRRRPRRRRPSARRPSSRSRTQPPTMSARPPARRRLRAQSSGDQLAAPSAGHCSAPPSVLADQTDR